MKYFFSYGYLQGTISAITHIDDSTIGAIDLVRSECEKLYDLEFIDLVPGQLNHNGIRLSCPDYE